MPNSIIQYSSTTFQSVYNDVKAVAELKDKPEWYLKYWAGVADVISLIINAQANQTYLSTAFTENAVDRLLELIDYQRTPHATSSGYILFDINRSAIFPFTSVAANLVAYSEGSLSVSSKRFESRANSTFAAITESFTASAGTNLLTVASVYQTGELVRLSTTGTLPTAVGGDLDAVTDYYTIYVGATTIYLARSRTDAYNGTYIDLTGAGTGTLTIHRFSKAVTVYQQTTVASYVVGKSDGATEWQEFDLADRYMLKDTLTVTINSIAYTRVDTFVYSISTDKVFKIKLKSDNKFSIVFPDGTYGAIPPAFDIYVSYAYGGGTESNISSLNTINSYGGSDSNLTGCTNYVALTGGADRQGITNAKILGPMLLKSRDRFVTTADGVYLALNYSGVTKATVVKNLYGILSCAVYIVPAGGGVAGAPLLAALQTYLIDRTILESIDVRCWSASYVTANVTSTVKIKTGYTWATVRDYYNLALDLIFSEITTEIQTTYADSGIDAARTAINTKWSFSFTSTNNAEIARILDSVTPHDFGVSIQISDVYGVTNNVEGVDYSIVSVPSFPITFAAGEIATAGTMTTTQI